MSTSTPTSNGVMSSPAPVSKARTADEQRRIRLFIDALTKAMVKNRLSQRRLATAIGVESGTFTNGVMPAVAPLAGGDARM